MTEPVLHQEFREAIKDGDSRLRDHIDQSIARLSSAVTASDKQVELALEAAEKLEIERIHRLEQRLDVAAGERAAAAEVLRDELHRTAQAAAEEREKSAQAVRASLELQIDALKREFIGIIDARTEVFRVIHDAADKAIAKAEKVNEDWRAQANEWRGQSADRERSQAEEMAKLSSTFLRADTAEAQFKAQREYVDAQFESLRRQITDINEKVSKLV